MRQVLLRTGVSGAVFLKCASIREDSDGKARVKEATEMGQLNAMPVPRLGPVL